MRGTAGASPNDWLNQRIPAVGRISSVAHVRSAAVEPASWAPVMRRGLLGLISTAGVCSDRGIGYPSRGVVAGGDHVADAVGNGARQLPGPELELVEVAPCGPVVLVGAVADEVTPRTSTQPRVTDTKPPGSARTSISWLASESDASDNARHELAPEERLPCQQAERGDRSG